MSTLDDLQAKAHVAREALDAPEQAAAELDSDTSEVAGQFAELGNDSIAQVLQQAGEHAAVCEQAKGTGCA